MLQSFVVFLDNVFQFINVCTLLQLLTFSGKCLMHVMQRLKKNSKSSETRLWLLRSRSSLTHEQVASCTFLPRCLKFAVLNFLAVFFAFLSYVVDIVSRVTRQAGIRMSNDPDFVAASGDWGGTAGTLINSNNNNINIISEHTVNRRLSLSKALVG